MSIWNKYVQDIMKLFDIDEALAKEVLAEMERTDLRFSECTTSEFNLEASYTYQVVMALKKGEKIMDYRYEAMRLVEEHMVDRNYMLLACLNHMSQDDVKEMLRINEIEVLKREKNNGLENR